MTQTETTSDVDRALKAKHAAMWASGDYPAVATRMIADLGPIVVEATGITEGQRVLDVAAGSGAFGRAFEEVVAIDLSSGQLSHNLARRRVQADAERLPFADDSFAAAGCAFAVNHVPQPEYMAREMARVAPIVAVSTWRRPEVDHAPKQILVDVLTRRLGTPRSPFALRVDVFNDAVGSVDAVHALLEAAGIRAEVREVEVEIPWPGVDAYLDYRLTMPSAPADANSAAIRREAAAAIAALPPDALVWRPHIIVGVGRR